MDVDAAVRWGIRGCTVGALALFVYWLFNPFWVNLAVAVGIAVLAYTLLRIDVRRHPLYPEPVGVDAVEGDGEEVIEDNVPSVSAVGIPLQYETHSARVRKR